MEVLAELEHALDVALAPAVMRDDTVAALTDHLLAAVDDDTSGRRSPATGQGTPPAPAVAPATAIVAMACRFPGASTPEEFWDLLAAGRDAVTAVPPGRWDGTPSAQAGESSTWSGGRWGSFLDDPAAFDAGHFGIGDEEARTLDPQARIFLELAHEALERAGYAGDRRRGLRVGVFAAVGDSGYRQILADAAPAGAPPAATALTGNLPNLVAARVAHCLDLDGPALAVDTACSSGLVALHLARRSLADGECDIAVVGGVNLHLTPDGYQALESAQALSPTGRSRAFSTAADGFAPGEGGAALVLRPLEEAGRDNDEILAVVRGTAVNNDGTSLSLMAPNPQRQHEAIGRAYEICGVDPRSVTYVEAHGTGTAVGDPIELRSLAQAFPADPDGRPRLLGSVKTNVGHLLNSAALPSLVKVVLALGHGRLPASLHHTSPSPAVERSGFALVTELTDWESHDPLRAGINAFGFGGTNAHAVLEQAPPAPASAPAPRAGGGPHLLTLSARSADGLAAWTSRLAGHLRDHPELDEGDVCLTAATARDEGPHRLALVADGDLRERLAEATAARDGRPPGVATGTVANRPRTVFVFPGQGALRPGQGRALYATAPVYRGTLDEASALVGAVHGRQLTSWCVDAEVDPQAQAATEVAQPLLVAHGVALARQLMAWGVRPDALVGHSVGELAAACVGGVLSLADAVWFAAERGRLMGTLTSPGSMLAVRGADEQDVAALVAASPGELAVAAYNGPGRLVISGSPDAVEQAAEKLAGLGAAVRPLRVSHAFHSPLMEPVARALADAARTLDTGVAGLPVMSTLTAGWQPRMDPDHLREHALRPVLFGRAVARLLDEGYDTFVELGPDENLAGPIRAAAAHRGVTGTDGTRVLVVSAPGERDRAGTAAEGGTPGGARELLETVGRLWTRGVTLDRTALDAGRRRVTLPPYPYQRRRYWPDTAAHGLLHRVTWQAAPLADDAPAGPVLVTGPDATAVRELAAQLAGRGTEATTDPEVVAAQTVVLLAGSTGRGTAAEFERMQRRWVTAFQEALALFDRTGARRLLVVTQDVHVTGHGSERPDPAQAVLGALALAVPEEFPGAVANWVDLASLDGAGQRLRAVLAEVAAPQAAGVVAWRDGQRLVRTVVPQPAETPHGGERLPADGTFLITGGCGGIGSALARDLAGRGRPVVILTGRSPQPPEGLVEELAALGADARYHPADLAAQDDVDKLVAELPRLDGVFHAAGVVRPGSLRSTDVQEAVDALRAKTLGTTLLSEALHRHGQRPAVCVAFSSVSSVLPGLAGALGVYAAANAFLDAFAVSERQAGRPWLSVNLGPFAETGLASSSRRRCPRACRNPPVGDRARAGRAAFGLRHGRGATGTCRSGVRAGTCPRRLAEAACGNAAASGRFSGGSPALRRGRADVRLRRRCRAPGTTCAVTWRTGVGRRRRRTVPVARAGLTGRRRPRQAAGAQDGAPMAHHALLRVPDRARAGRPPRHAGRGRSRRRRAGAGRSPWPASGRGGRRHPLRPHPRTTGPAHQQPAAPGRPGPWSSAPDDPRPAGHPRPRPGVDSSGRTARHAAAAYRRRGRRAAPATGADDAPADLVRGARGDRPEPGRRRIGALQPAFRPCRRTAGAGCRTPSGTEPGAPAAGGPSRGGGRVQPQRPGRRPVGPVHLAVARRTTPTDPASAGLRDVRGSARPLPRFQQPGRHPALLGGAPGRTGRTAAAAVRR